MFKLVEYILNKFIFKYRGNSSITDLHSYLSNYKKYETITYT